jgi:thiol:disulfide interchange protein DsbG
MELINRRNALIALSGLSSVLLAGCNPPDSSQQSRTAPSNPGSGSAENDRIFDQVNRMHSFVAGPKAISAASSVHVVFDPSCPHCGATWRAARPLTTTVAFRWAPVGLMNANSRAWAATLLGAEDPVAAMDRHEELLMSKSGGIAVDQQAVRTRSGQVDENNALAVSIKLDSIPMIVYRDRSGRTQVVRGAMTEAQIRSMIG